MSRFSSMLGIKCAGALLAGYLVRHHNPPRLYRQQGSLRLSRSSPVARAKCSYRTVRLIAGRHPESGCFSALIDALVLITLDDIRDEPVQLRTTPQAVLRNNFVQF